LGHNANGNALMMMMMKAENLDQISIISQA
jgi:hypothetical protein